MIVNSDLTMGRHVIERYEVESFLTLAEELHFGRTAERLRVSAAHVSQTIRKLERRVGAALFHRSSRRVELTPLGRALAEELGPARAAVGAALQAAVEAGRGCPAACGSPMSALPPASSSSGRPRRSAGGPPTARCTSGRRG